MHHPGVRGVYHSCIFCGAGYQTWVLCIGVSFLPAELNPQPPLWALVSEKAEKMQNCVLSILCKIWKKDEAWGGTPALRLRQEHCEPFLQNQEEDTKYQEHSQQKGPLLGAGHKSAVDLVLLWGTTLHLEKKGWSSLPCPSAALRAGPKSASYSLR